MPGRLGGRSTTVANLKIAFVDVDQNLIGVSGGVLDRRKE